jgi:NAD(P)H-hydrate epimerase
MIPLYSADQVRSADNYAISELKIPGVILMENAARSIADAVIKKYPYIDSSYKFGIVCGKGNNGGDGFALARHLLILGFRVTVISLGIDAELKGDALANYNITKRFIEEFDHSSFIYFKNLKDLEILNDCDFIVDALLGTGGKGELKEPYSGIVERLNEKECLKIAVDAPTGLNLDNGYGSKIFKADLTVTLAALKTGLFYLNGKYNSGKVVKGSIGMGSRYFDLLNTSDYLIEPEDCIKFLPVKEENIHKYSAGKVLTIAGSKDLPGAAFFTMNAAMISGTGAGILAFPSSIRTLAQSHMNSAVTEEYIDEGKGYLTEDNLKSLHGKIEWADCVAIGPGLGRNPETKSAVYQIIKKYKNKSFVIDADAITALGEGQYSKVDLRSAVITPHHGEFAALLDIDLNALEADLLNFGRSFTKETGAVLVLKGAPTIVFNREGEIFINTSGNKGLAKFGSGDVLTGMIASFIAQSKEIEESAIAAVYLHGLTADLITKKESEFSLIPQKIIDTVPESIIFLRKSIV